MKKILSVLILMTTLLGCAPSPKITQMPDMVIDTGYVDSDMFTTYINNYLNKEVSHTLSFFDENDNPVSLDTLKLNTKYKAVYDIDFEKNKQYIMNFIIQDKLSPEVSIHEALLFYPDAEMLCGIEVTDATEFYIEISQVDPATEGKYEAHIIITDTSGNMTQIYNTVEVIFGEGGNSIGYPAKSIVNDEPVPTPLP